MLAIRLMQPVASENLTSALLTGAWLAMSTRGTRAYPPSFLKPNARDMDTDRAQPEGCAGRQGDNSKDLSQMLYRTRCVVESHRCC